MQLPDRVPGAAFVSLAALLAGALGCGTTRPLEPLTPGQTALGVSLGGPLLHTLGTVFPTPILTLAGAHGLASVHEAPLAVTGAVNLTAAAFGTVHVEPGLLVHRRARGAGPTLAAASSVHVLTDGRSVLVAPSAAGVAAWQLGSRWQAFAGADVAVPIARGGTRIIAGPLGGAAFTRGATTFNLELKWLAPYHDVAPAAPEWISPFSRGFFTVLLGAAHRFGGTP